MLGVGGIFAMGSYFFGKRRGQQLANKSANNTHAVETNNDVKEQGAFQVLISK